MWIDKKWTQVNFTGWNVKYPCLYLVIASSAGNILLGVAMGSTEVNIAPLSPDGVTEIVADWRTTRVGLLWRLPLATEVTIVRRYRNIIIIIIMPCIDYTVAICQLACNFTLYLPNSNQSLPQCRKKWRHTFSFRVCNSAAELSSLVQASTTSLCIVYVFVLVTTVSFSCSDSHRKETYFIFVTVLLKCLSVYHCMS